MFNLKSVLLYAFLLDLLLNPTLGWKDHGHSYPKSSGLSGKRLNSGGLFGGGHPKSGSGGHAYPPSKGLSGASSYPLSGGGQGYGHPPNNFPMPPHTISYTPVRGAPPVYYPAYVGQPPTYVDQYKRSGSKYGPLLAGLALLNLGTLGAAAYTASKKAKTPYKPEPGQVCKFGVMDDNLSYEETKIDCDIISSFILEHQAQLRARESNTTAVVTLGPSTPAVHNVLYAMLPNGILVPVNATSLEENSLMDTLNTTLANALDVKGKTMNVTLGMQCYVSSTSPTHVMKRSVPCGLLQTYANRLPRHRKNFSAHTNRPMFTIVPDVIMSSIFFYLFHRRWNNIYDLVSF